MSSESQTDRKIVLAEDALPPVRPPDASFILQLFLIPMIIVAIIVSVWLLFSWIANAGADPYRLVRDMRSLNKESWHKAFVLAGLLRNPQYAHLRQDRQLCGELAEILRQELAVPTTDEERIRFRVYLCKVLGEFRLEDPIAVLVQAAGPDQPMDVRYAAIESLAVLCQAEHVGAERMREHAEAVNVLLEAARERGATGRDRQRDELRSTAAFALGVLGGEEALAQLKRMLQDAYPNARYNAAMGLARHGDPACIPVLLEMLDYSNPEVVEGETSESARVEKRRLVCETAIQGVRLLANRLPQEQLTPLITALQKLADDGNVLRLIRYRARETLAEITAQSP